MSDRTDSHMSRVEAKGSRHIIRSIGAIVAGFLVIVVLSVGTDVVMHATGIYPPWFQYMPDWLLCWPLRIALSTPF